MRYTAGSDVARFSIVDILADWFEIHFTMKDTRSTNSNQTQP